jgi:phosphoribosyl 1,2-cyclic phosphodiesterase
VLFHQDVVVATLASGSKGNCTFIGDHRRGVLVDCGLSTKQILLRMEQLGLGDARIDAVLLTHEHNDHVGAARVLDDRLFKRQGERVPFHLTAGTDMGLPKRVRPTTLVRVASGDAFQVGAFTIEPFTVPHDTRDPVAYAVQLGDLRCGVITDLGRSTRLVERMVSQMDVCVLEFNHDVEMLMDGPYPWRLKQRVRGHHGHLSNGQAAALLRQGASAKLRHVVLAHLSDDNNEPDVAREAAEQALHDIGLSRCKVHVAEQRQAVGPFEVSAPLPLREPTRVAEPRPRRHAEAPARPPEPVRQQALFG